MFMFGIRFGIVGGDPRTGAIPPGVITFCW